MSSERSEAQRATFAAFFAESFDDVVRFSARRVTVSLAEDVAAEALTIAWRRVDQLPDDHGDRRAWVFTIARNLMLNAARDQRRQNVLAVRLANEAEQHVPGADVLATARTDLSRGWHLLSDRHREALALSMWDGLTSPQAATVLGISPVAYRLRLTRARAALNGHLGAQSPPRPDPRTQSAHHPHTAASEAK